MHNLEDQYKWLSQREWVSRKNDGDKVVVFERGGLVWAFNFHPHKSFSDYRIGTNMPGPYKAVLSSDDKEFMGHDRISKQCEHFTTKEQWDGRDYWFQVYLPSRTCAIYAPQRK